MKKITQMLCIAAMACALTGFVGCKEKGPMEKAGEQIDEAAKKTGDAMKEGAEKTEEAAKEAAKKAEEATK